MIKSNGWLRLGALLFQSRISNFGKVLAKALLRASLIFLICHTTWAAEPSPGANLSIAEIQSLIKQLDGPSFQLREQAMHQLLKIGEPAASQLEEATRHRSAEVRHRATTLLRQLRLTPLRDSFSALARLPDEKIDLIHGLWLVSKILNPYCRREKLDAELDRLADKVRTRLGADVRPASVAPAKIVETMRIVLYEEEKFLGNEADYNNPDNSSLEKVLATRKGLPILLSHIMIAVGDRLSVPLVGVPAPGRYLVKYDGQRAPAGFPRKDILFDAFAGKEIPVDEFVNRFPRVERELLLKPSTRRQILVRVLTNLERHLFDQNRSDQGNLVVECRLILAEAPEESDE